MRGSAGKLATQLALMVTALSLVLIVFIGSRRATESARAPTEIPVAVPAEASAETPVPRTTPEPAPTPSGTPEAAPVPQVLRPETVPYPARPAPTNLILEPALRGDAPPLAPAVARLKPAPVPTHDDLSERWRLMSLGAQLEVADLRGRLRVWEALLELSDPPDFARTSNKEALMRFLETRLAALP